jgi:wobble nucleotide-excising tRNase
MRPSMKFRRIIRIRNYRVFRDFNWQGDLPDFGQFNLIYGWNGSGKTTLSTLFRHLQTKQAIGEGEVQFLIDDNIFDGNAIPSAALPQVRVFNRDSIKRSIFEIPNEQLPPVYFFGEDSAEKQKQIEALKKDGDDAAKERQSWEGKKRTAAADFETFCTDRAREIKNLLTVPGGGIYNTYDARPFKETATRLVAATSPVQPLTNDKRQQYLAAKEGTPKGQINAISIEYPDFAELTRQAERTLNGSVLSQTLTELVADPQVASWVSQGLQLHTGERETDKCHFCGQPLSPERLEALKGHFNDEFARFQAEVDSLIADIDNAKSTMEGIDAPNRGLLYPHLAKDYEAHLATLNDQVSKAILYLDALRTALVAKKGKPFAALDLLPFLPASSPADKSTSALEKINTVIGDHNKHTDNFAKEVRDARRALEQDEVLRVLVRYWFKQQSVGVAEKARQKAGETIQRIGENIAELEKQVRHHQRPAEELNKEMAAYLGSEELRFKVQESGYTIARHGLPALNLSESERTAIAFMYFLKSLSDTGFDIKTGVVIIDDPVSSLDANSLYCAFGFMKARTLDAGQLFVLTHNFTFFRQVRNWFHHLNRGKGNDVANHPAHFYMLSTVSEGGHRGSMLGRLDPFLREFESEYQYLFKRVYDDANRQAPPASLASYCDLPNIARRLLEAFLAFKNPGVAHSLYAKLGEINFDDGKKARLLRFLDTYSHADQICEPAHDLSLLSETPAVLKDLLELIQREDPKHYAGMVSRLAP